MKPSIFKSLKRAFDIKRGKTFNLKEMFLDAYYKSIQSAEPPTKLTINNIYQYYRSRLENV